MPTKVSVVIACYNSGDGLNEVVKSLDEQTMSPDEFDVAFVDDGSTDDTLVRLHEIAAHRRNVVVKHIPNSGWPGRPRNVGIAATSGEYVLFMDHDDGLFPEALERAYNMASANTADLLLAKEIQTNAPTVGWSVYPRQVESTQVVTEAMLAVLTPHKFYRRAFLDQHGIRFKEGKIRLEDYLLNYQVLAHSPRISILADYPCYKWIHHGAQNTHAKFDQDVYWQVFNEILDAVDSSSLSEEAKDPLKSRLYKTRVLWNVGPRLVGRSPAGRVAIVKRLTALANDRFPAHLDQRLAAIDRPRAYYLRSGNVEQLVRLAQADQPGGALDASLESARWVGGTLEVVARVRLVTDAGAPLLLRRQGDRVLRVLPAPLDQQVPAALLDVTDDLAGIVAEMSVRGRESYAEWSVPSTADIHLVDVAQEVTGAGEGVVAIEAVITGRLDPQTTVFGRPLDTEVWGVTARMSALGHVRSTRITSAGFAPTAIRLGQRGALAYSTVADRLAVDLGEPARIARLAGLKDADGLGDEPSVAAASGAATADSSTPLKVSVIIACYNPGDRINLVISSLDRQTMPATEFEVIFVDDGSTDDTLARLETFAAERPNMSVSTIPNSGWPGRPRNLGMASATGEYVLFMDHDDGLFPEALERSYNFAKANSADLLLAKEIGVNGPTISWIAFLKQVPATREIDEAILSLLTPHKFYRRAFLEQHGILFKEGKIRLEDYLFNYLVFVHHPVVSILAEYPTYQWVHHPTSNAVSSFDVNVYWQVFDEIIDVVDKADVSDEQRDRLYMRLYKNRVLWNVSERMSKRTPAGQRRIFERMHTLARDRFPAHLDARLPAVDRPRAHLLRRGDFDSLLELSTFDRSGFAIRPTLESARWVDGVLEVSARMRMSTDDGGTFLLRREGGRVFRALTPGLHEAIPAELLDLTDDLELAIAEMSVRGRESWVEWQVPSGADSQLVDVPGGLALEFVLHGRIDPTSAAFGVALTDDVWSPVARLSALGHSRSSRIQAPGFTSALGQVGNRKALVYTTRAGNLAIDMSDQTRLARMIKQSAPAVEKALPKLAERVQTTPTGRRLRAVVKRIIR